MSWDFTHTVRPLSDLSILLAWDLWTYVHQKKTTLATCNPSKLSSFHCSLWQHFIQQVPVFTAVWPKVPMYIFCYRSSLLQCALSVTFQMGLLNCKRPGNDLFNPGHNHYNGRVQVSCKGRSSAVVGFPTAWKMGRGAFRKRAHGARQVIRKRAHSVCMHAVRKIEFL